MLPRVWACTWRISRLTVTTLRNASSNEQWDGPTFQAAGLSWRLVVRPRHSDAEPQQLAIYLELLDDTHAPVEFGQATLQIRGLSDVEINARFSKSKEHDSAHPKCSPWWRHFVLHSSLNSKAVLGDGPLGQLVISVTMRSRSFAEMKVPEPQAPSRADLIAAMLPVAGAPLPDGVDVVFKAAHGEGERIAAHSFVLALHSSVLRYALWSAAPANARRGAAASQPREVDVPEGITAAAFRRVVEYLYVHHDDDDLLDKNPLNIADVRDLLHAADLLDVPRLRETCAAELHKRLTVDDAVATLILAQSLSCTSLVEAALRFIAANASAVMRTPGWAELIQQPALLQTVVSTIATGEPPAKKVARMST